MFSKSWTKIESGIFVPIQTSNRGSIIVWRLGGFRLFLDAEYGFWKEINVVYRFSVAARLRKIEM